MHIRFWPPQPKSEQTEQLDQQQEQLEAINARPVQSSLVQMTAQFQSFIQRNFPQDFDYKISQAAPFLTTSIIMWPSYWLYRGLDWAHQRSHTTLTTYIHKTYVQAKCIQLALLATALLIHNSRNYNNETNMLEDLKMKKNKS